LLEEVESYEQLESEKFRAIVNLDKHLRAIEQTFVQPQQQKTMFVVLAKRLSGAESEIANVIERVCERRRQDGRHAIRVNWETILNNGNFQRTLNTMIQPETTQQTVYWPAIKTLEQIICKGIEQPRIGTEHRLSFNVVIRQQQQQGLIEVVARILGQTEYEILRRDEKTTLIELGLTSEMCIPIKRVLEEVYNVPLTVRDIQMLSIEQLKAIEVTKRVSQTQQVPIQQQQWTGRRGLNYLMPSRIIERLNEWTGAEYEQQTPLFIIHPVEGHLNMIRSWAQQMKCPVYGVHLSQEIMQQQFESVEQLAKFYWEQIEKELLTNNKYNQYQTGPVRRVHLGGFSFGSLVAMEMAAQRAHQIASLNLIEATTPTFFSKWNTTNTTVSPVELECEALAAFLQQYTQQTQPQFVQQELIRMPTTEQRVRYVVREIVQRSPFQLEPVDLEQAARAYLLKSVLATRYQPRKYVTIPEVLIVKSAQQQPRQVQLVEQTLGHIFGGKIQSQLLDGDYRSYFVGKTGAQLAQIINEYTNKYQF